jgi:hypothetical protein
MALLSKQEFSSLCQIRTKDLSVYIGRKKVKVRGDDKIDTEDTINVAFMDKKGVTAATVVSVPSGKVAKVEGKKGAKKAMAAGTQPADPNQPDYHISNARLKHLDTQKREEEIKHLRLKNSKTSGELMPAALVEPLFVQHNQSFLTSFNQVAGAILTEFGHIKKFTPEEMAQMRTRMVEQINKGMNDAMDITTSSLKTIITEYAQSRGVGERE